MRYIEPGTTIARRSVDRQKHVVQTAIPSIVVRSDQRSIVLFMSPGTQLKLRTGRYGGPRGRMLLEWDGGYADRIWRETNVLMLHRFGDAHSFWLARDDATARLAWWYVNLEEPWRETAIGSTRATTSSTVMRVRMVNGIGRTRTSSHGRSSKAWSRPPEAELLAEGERALERFRRHDPPLDRPWLDFRPDPGWTIPVLPDGWRDFEPR